MTAILTFAPAGVSTGFSGTSANSSTPPIIVMSVAKEPLFRKSRRLNPKGSLSISFIAVRCLLSLSQGDNTQICPQSYESSSSSWPKAKTFLCGSRAPLSADIPVRHLLRYFVVHLRASPLQPQRPLNPTQNVLLIKFTDSLGVF